MVELEDVREQCLKMRGVSEGYPFGEDVLVFKVMGKVFCLMNLEAVPGTMNLKCDPDRAVELREQYDSIKPGYHQNKKHWNTLVIDGGVPDDLLTELVEHSYALVVSKLRKKDREELERLE